MAAALPILPVEVASLTDEIQTRTPGLKVFPTSTQKCKKFSATYKGYHYVHHMTGNEKQLLRCTQHNTNCRARLHLSFTYKSVVFEEMAAPSFHNHFQDGGLCDRRHTMWKLKSMAKVTTESTAGVIATHLANFDEEVLGSFPKFNSIQRAVQRSRAASNLPSMSVSSRAELPLLYGHFKTETGEDFVKFDSGCQQDRIIIFCTDANLQCLFQSDHWFADGTFKTQPILFAQFFTIHGLKMDGPNVLCVPLVFCLAPNKTTQTYRNLFKKLLELKPNLAPKSIMMDFEHASRSAFIEVFPVAEQRGCFFHFRQAFFRHIQSDPDLFESFSDATFKIHVCCLVSLAFVPSTDLVVAFEELDQSVFFRRNRAVLDKFLDYFLNTWIGGFDRRGKRKNPLFSHDLWNCYSSVLEDLPKTNNFCEGFHRGFLSLLSVHHPTIPKFAEALLKQKTLSTLRLELFNTSQAANPKSRSVKNAVRLKKCVMRYGKVPTLDYLRGISHCFLI